MSSVFQIGKRYLLADLGGETTNAAVYEVFGCGLMKELYCSVGGAWGGTYVNKNFVKLLEQIFGKDVIDGYRANYPGDWVDFISVKFETGKGMAAPGTTTFVDVPFSFLMFLRKTKKMSLQDCVVAFGEDNVKLSHGRLALKDPEVAKLFDPVSTSIADHLKSIFAMFDSIDCLILVGGFAECRLLQLHLRREFEEAGGVHVIVPRQCSLAVAKGAVLLGHRRILAGVPTVALSKSSLKKDFAVCL